MSAIDEKVSKLIRPEIQRLEAYRVPDAAGLIKLDAMENPYPWPADVKRAWYEVLSGVALNRYPDPSARALKARLRTTLGVPSAAELLLGNGSDELIQIILLALARPGAAVLAPTPTFVMYEMIARFVGMKFVGVPLGADFSLDLEAMRAASRQHQPAAVFLAYPNNPTGNLFDEAAVDTLIREAPGLVVLDEAYYAFAQASFLNRVGDHDNVLVIRTLSKQGLAGLRLGLLAGPRPWLTEFDKVRLPYNVGSLNQASAEFALRHGELLATQATRIRADRDALQAALQSLPGIRVWPSRANFILFRVECREAPDVFRALLLDRVLVKNLHPAGGPLAGCLRVTVGTPDENAAFLAALKRAL